MRTAPEKNILSQSIQDSDKLVFAIDCVIFGYGDRGLELLLIACDIPGFHDRYTFPVDLIDFAEDFDAASYRVLRKQIGMRNIYLEQVATSGKSATCIAG